MAAEREKNQDGDFEEEDAKDHGGAGGGGDDWRKMEERR
jgi:hypothetical protein